jgi:hypothetical protein
VGRLVEVEGATIVLDREKHGGPERLSVARRDVVAFEVSERRSKKGKGAWIGAVAGLGAAVVIGVVEGQDCHAGDIVCFSPGTTALLSGILTVPAGALVGAAVAPGEKWRPAPVSGLSVQPVAARGGGLGVRVAIGF